MSHAYEPAFVQDAQLREEAARVQQALLAPERFIELQYLHGEPPRVRKGMVVLADGTDWNPGSGAGMYRRSEDNASWVFIG